MTIFQAFLLYLGGTLGIYIIVVLVAYLSETKVTTRDKILELEDKVNELKREVGSSVVGRWIFGLVAMLKKEKNGNT